MIDRDQFAELDASQPIAAGGDGDAPIGERGAASGVPASSREALRPRIEAADRALSRGMHSVDVPAGLADRILARLGASSLEESPQVSAVPTKRPVNRRLFVLGGIVAAAAAAVVAVQVFQTVPEAWTAQRLVEAAVNFYVQDQEKAVAQTLETAPDDFPYSRDLWPTATGWRRVKTPFIAAEAIAYELRLGGSAGTLYVLDPEANVTGLPENAPPSPDTPTTQGACAAAWQDRGRVYVLVVAGGPAEYRQFLRTAPGPIARGEVRGSRIEREVRAS